jgi:hypothetical protein
MEATVTEAPGTTTGSAHPSDRIDTSVAHPARRYNYWLGGKDNFQADRESGDAMAARFPTIRTSALENRRFLQRAVRHLAREAGIRQFLDIGTGIPTADNTHEVAQAVAPESRVVYVDNDPIVLAHARALLTSSPEGATAYIDADLREPEKILRHPDLLRTIDLSRPVGLMLVAILHFVTPGEDPYAIVNTLLDAVPSGSYLAISHLASDIMADEMSALYDRISERTKETFVLRSRAEVSRFFDDLDLVDPGVVLVNEWHTDSGKVDLPVYAAVGVKP